MKRKLHSLFTVCIAVCAILLASCENEIPYHQDDTEPKLTLNGFINADSLKNKLYLSLTGETRIQLVSNTVVEVRVNGELKEVLDAVREEGTQLRSVDITTRFQPGDRVRIDARTQDGTYHAWVEEVVPSPVKIDRIDTSKVIVPPKPIYFAQNNIRFNIRFKDAPGEKNYYRIVLEQRHILKGRTWAGDGAMEAENVAAEFKIFNFWPWEDIALTDGRPATSDELDSEIFERETNLYGVFDDSWFEGSEYTLNVQVYQGNISYPSDIGFSPEYLDVDVAVRLLSITEAEYYYLTTMNIIDSDILDDYISDPVKIPSNVNGGNGFVGISTETGEVIRIIKNKRIQYAGY